MALEFDQITAMAHALIEDSAADNFFDSKPLFFWLKERGNVMVMGNPTIQLPIVYDDVDAAGSYQDYDILDTTPNEQHTAAKAEWKNYYVNVVVSKPELLRQGGKNAVIDLLRSKVEVGNMKMADQISTDLHSTNGDSATGITGLRNMLSTTTTHHNIATADASVWVAGNMDTSTTQLTLRAMDDMWEELTIGSDSPNMIVTTRAMLSKYKSLLVANQRFGEAEKVSGGFRAVMFNDAPVFADPDVSGTGSGTNDSWMYFLNTRWLRLYIHREDNFVSTPFPVFANQNVVGSRLTATLQLATNNRRMHGGFDSLDPGE